MKTAAIADLSVAEIMTCWPATIRVFIELHMHCIGCPISVFHTLSQAADEHGLELQRLTAMIDVAIAPTPPKAGREEVRRQ